MKHIKWMLVVTALAVTARAAMVNIDGTNTVGYTTLALGTSSNLIISVPFDACMSVNPAGMLADLVATNNLTQAATADVADQLVVLTTNGADTVYYYYFNKTGEGWTKINTRSVSNGVEVAIEPPAATNFPIARGLGFWIKRASASSSVNLFLKGQVATGKQATVLKKGLNLVGLSDVTDVDLQGKDWTGASFGAPSVTDKIYVNNENGTLTEYQYRYTGSVTNWVNTLNNSNGAITNKVGKGFWYLRKAATEFTFKPDGK